MCEDLMQPVQIRRNLDLIRGYYGNEVDKSVIIVATKKDLSIKYDKFNERS